ncbi:MAG: replicative DNA helicase [Lachnospiraceae bacterium]|nr:replicative DNA helicase [Lachnospiraceae bacterium]
MPEDVIKRIMPHSLEAEQSVLGSMIVDTEAVETASEYVTADDFYSRQNGIVYDAICELSAEGADVDAVTLQTRLKEKNLPPEACSTEYLRSLVALVPTSANIRSYAQIVAEKSMLRKLIKASDKISNDCYAETDRLDTIMDSAEKSIFELSQKRNTTDLVPIQKIVIDAVKKIEQASLTKGNVTGIATGFTDLDNRTAGFQRSDLILIAARPSMGKTALALNIAEYAAFHDDRCVAIFSLEMSKEQLVNRLIAMESHVDAQKIRTGDLDEAEWIEIVKGAGRIGRSRLIIDDTPAISVPEIRSKCRKYKSEFGLQMIFIDYLQLMSGSAHSSDASRQQEISDISRALKSLARELEVPVIALSQLSRAVEGRPNHRPMLSDLRESGAIEQDADVVMFIYRDDYYNEDSEKKGLADIIIAKQRNGPIATVELSWLPQYTKFANYAGPQPPAGGD